MRAGMRFNLVQQLYIGEMSKKGSCKRGWSTEEDSALKQLYEGMRLNKWSLIADQLEADFGFAGRTGKQCRQRYNNHLDPALNREDWAEAEEKKLFQLHDQLGNRWAVISQQLGVGRTDNSVKNHFFSKLRKSLRRLNRIIHEDYKKEIRQIHTKVLYKILEACEEKFKPEPMCDSDTSQAASNLKNRILMFSYEDEELLSEEGQRIARDLILDIVGFNRNYKRKPKKFRRTNTQNYDTLQVPLRNSCTPSNDSFSNSSNSHLDSKSDFESDNEWEDHIHHHSPALQPQTKKMIAPIILRTKSQPQCQIMMEEKVEESIMRAESAGDGGAGCEQRLEELGLLQELDAGIHPFLMRKQTSLFSRRSSEMQEDDIKFFEDSEIEMRILMVPLPQSLKKESYDEALFHD